jgi:hypothetical protein
MKIKKFGQVLESHDRIYNSGLFPGITSDDYTKASKILDWYESLSNEHKDYINFLIQTNISDCNDLYASQTPDY